MTDVPEGNAIPEDPGRSVFLITEGTLAIGSRIATLIKSDHTKIDTVVQDPLVKQNLETIRDNICKVFDGFFTYRTRGSNVFLESVPSSPYTPKHTHAEGNAGCRWKILSSRGKSASSSHYYPPLSASHDAPRRFPVMFYLTCNMCYKRFVTIICEEDPNNFAQSNDGLDTRPAEPETTAYRSACQGYYWIKGNISVKFHRDFFDHDNVPATFEQFSAAWSYSKGL